MTVENKPPDRANVFKLNAIEARTLRTNELVSAIRIISTNRVSDYDSLPKPSLIRGKSFILKLCRTPNGLPMAYRRKTLLLFRSKIVQKKVGSY